jgi:hypothetical protein
MVKPLRRLTDPKWLLRYAIDNPKRALLYGAAALVVVGIATASVAIEAIPIWIGALVAGPAFIAVAREPLRRARLVWAANDTATGSATDGVVSVSGRARGASDRRLTSELQAVDCLAYEYTKKRSKNRGGQEGSTTKTKTDQQVLPFYVDDGSGPVLVDASTGTLTLHVDETERGGSTTYNEGVIREGDEVTVYGEVQDDTRDLPADADRVVTTGPEYGDVVVTDRHGARVAARQGLNAVALFVIGGILIVGGIGLALGVVSL